MKRILIDISDWNSESSVLLSEIERIHTQVKEQAEIVFLVSQAQDDEIPPKNRKKQHLQIIVKTDNFKEFITNETLFCTSGLHTPFEKWCVLSYKKGISFTPQNSLDLFIENGQLEALPMVENPLSNIAEKLSEAISDTLFTSVKQQLKIEYSVHKDKDIEVLPFTTIKELLPKIGEEQKAGKLTYSIQNRLNIAQKYNYTASSTTKERKIVQFFEQIANFKKQIADVCCATESELPEIEVKYQNLEAEGNKVVLCGENFHLFEIETVNEENSYIEKHSFVSLYSLKQKLSEAGVEIPKVANDEGELLEIKTKYENLEAAGNKAILYGENFHLFEVETINIESPNIVKHNFVELYSLKQKLSKAGVEIQKVSTNEVEEKLKKAAFTATENLCLYSEKQFHLINPKPEIQQIVESFTEIAKIHIVESQTTVIEKLYNAIQNYTVADYEYDPTLDKIIEQLDPKGELRYEYLHARTTLQQTGNIQEPKENELVEGDLIAKLKTIFSQNPPFVRESGYLSSSFDQLSNKIRNFLVKYEGNIHLNTKYGVLSHFVRKANVYAGNEATAKVEYTEQADTLKISEKSINALLNQGYSAEVVEKLKPLVGVYKMSKERYGGKYKTNEILKKMEIEIYSIFEKDKFIITNETLKKLSENDFTIYNRNKYQNKNVKISDNTISKLQTLLNKQYSKTESSFETDIETRIGKELVHKDYSFQFSDVVTKIMEFAEWNNADLDERKMAEIIIQNGIEYFEMPNGNSHVIVPKQFDVKEDCFLWYQLCVANKKLHNEAITQEEKKAVYTSLENVWDKYKTFYVTVTPEKTAGNNLTNTKIYTNWLSVRDALNRSNPNLKTPDGNAMVKLKSGYAALFTISEVPNLKDKPLMICFDGINTESFIVIGNGLKVNVQIYENKII